MKWILEGTLENYSHMYDETAEFYTKLSGSYSILNGKEKEIEKEIEKNTSKLITLEKYIIIENNIEHCNTILLLLELIDTRNTTLFQIENNYMICLIYNLIESVRLYKISCLKKLN